MSAICGRLVVQGANMIEIPFRFAAALSLLSGGRMWVEALLLPENGIVVNGSRQGKHLLAEAVRRQLKSFSPEEIYRRHIASSPRVDSIEIKVGLAKPTLAWREPFPLRLEYLRWRHGDEASIAYCPALETTILARNDAELSEMLEAELRLAVDRRHLSLPAMVDYARFESLAVARCRTNIKVASERERKLAQEASLDKEKSTLDQVAQRLDPRSLPKTYERDDLVKLVTEALFGRPARSILLVGPSGVGKSAIFQEVARQFATHIPANHPSKSGRLAPSKRQTADTSGVPLWQAPFWTTSGSQIIAGALGFGMWQQRCQKLIREATQSKAIVHLGNLFELCEVGKGGGDTLGLAGFLRPSLQRGQWLAVVECTPEQLARIERSDPQQLEAFRRIEVKEPSADLTQSILLGVAAEERGAAAPTVEALTKVDELHRRFATYSAAPGRQVRFLRNLIADRKQRRIEWLKVNRGSQTDSSPPDGTMNDPVSAAVTAEDVYDGFGRETGLPRWMIDPAVPLDLDAAHQWFSRRVVGQSQPIRLLVDLIAVIKAGLQRGGKPIASLLFIGPTGVGKTETSKALAEFLYRDPQRLIRIDMSEFSDPWGASRLVGGPFGTEGLLTQKLRDQPFSVVLLDEFEKAHPAVFDLLLQALGEGRLTDGAGRVADFSSAVVIMTSNLGAESMQRASVGFGGETNAATIENHFLREVQRFVRPEFFNRIDRVVPFAPLARDAIERIARREIDKVLERDGIRRRNVRVSIDEEVVAALARDGYDPRYGARPLRRVIEHKLVAPLSAHLNEHDAARSLTCQVSANEEGFAFGTRVEAEPPPLRGIVEKRPHILTQAVDATVVRRLASRLDRSTLVLRMQNELAMVEQNIRQARAEAKRKALEKTLTETQAMAAQMAWAGYTELDAKAAALRDQLKEIATLVGEAQLLEDAMLLPLCRGELATDQQAQDHSGKLAALSKQLGRKLREYYASTISGEGLVTLIIYSTEFDWLRQLANAYGGVIESIMQASEAPRDELRWFFLTPHREPLSTATESSASIQSKLNEGGWPVWSYLTRTIDERVVKVFKVFRIEKERQWEHPPPEAYGVALTIHHRDVAIQLANEVGNHSRFGEPHFAPARVDIHMHSLITYSPADDILREGKLGECRLRRVYNFPREFAQDLIIGENVPLKRTGLSDTILSASAKDLERQIWGQLE